MPSRLRQCCGFLLLGVALANSPAWAGSNPAAEALFERGRTAMKSGDFETACQHFAESERLEPAVGTRFNLAHCEEKRGRLATAWVLYKSVVADLSAADERLPFAKEKVRALEARVPKLTLVLQGGSAQGVRVKVAGSEFTASSFGIPLPIDPGEHSVEVLAPGQQPQRSSVRVAVGQLHQFEFSVPKSRDAGEPLGVRQGPSTPPPVSESETDGNPASSTRRLGYVVGGAGLASLSGGAILGAIVLYDKRTANDNCWPPDENYASGGCYPEGARANERGRMLAPWTTVALGVGAVGLGVGAYLVISNPVSGDHTTRVAMHPSPAGARISVQTRF